MSFAELWTTNVSLKDLSLLTSLLIRNKSILVYSLSYSPGISRLAHAKFNNRIKFCTITHQNGAELDAFGSLFYCHIEELGSRWSRLLAECILDVWASINMPHCFLNERSRLYAELEARYALGELPLVAALCEKQSILQSDSTPRYLLVPSHLASKRMEDELQLDGVIFLRKAPDLFRAITLSFQSLGCMQNLTESHFKRINTYSPSSGLLNILVRRSEGFDLSRRSDLFWFPQSGINPSRVVYFLTHRMPGLSGDKERMAKWGIKPVPLTDELAGELGAPAWKPKPAPPRPCALSAPLQMMARAFRRQPWGRIALAAAAGERLLSQAAYWAEFLDDHQVAADFSGGETDQAMKAKHVALDLRGGVQFARQRSMFWMMPLGAEIGLNHGHVIFLWGRDGRQVVQAAGNRLICGVVTGFIYDYTIAEAREKAALLRQRLMEQGARFAVALFDVNPATPAVTPEDYLAFYHGFLDWLEQDESLALIAKPKKEIDETLAPGLRERLESLAARTKRVVTLPVRTQPAVAALASDCAVGIGFNSAVTEAVIMGKPGIHWDRGRVRSHPYYQWGRGKVVFNDLDAMLAALEKWRANPRSQPGLGDFSPIIDELDPFRDGEAHARAGSYVRWVVDALAEGRGRDRALEEANQRYAQRWGSDKIIKFS